MWNLGSGWGSSSAVMVFFGAMVAGMLLFPPIRTEWYEPRSAAARNAIVRVLAGAATGGLLAMGGIILFRVLRGTL